MDEEIVVDQGVSEYGLHRLHVIKMNEPVDVIHWIKEMSCEGQVQALYRYEDEELGIHHLRMWWRNNEVNNGRK